jgi:predicted regulator of amino acid metabolism with ACT domain
MRGKHIKIELGEEARNELEKFTRTGKRSVKLLNRAKIILELDEADGRKPLTQAKIAEKVGVDRRTVNDAKQAFLAADSVSAFLQRKKRETPPVQPKITGDVEAHIIALACSRVPEGYSKWGVRLLADKCIDLNYIDAISFKSVQRVLKKYNLSLT